MGNQGRSEPQAAGDVEYQSAPQDGYALIHSL